MSKLKWGQTGERKYETGVDKGVLYKQVNGAYPLGVVWNGLVNVTEKPSGAEPTSLYADNIKYLTLMSAEELGLTIEAYTYPDEFGECDGSMEAAKGVSLGQQDRASFGMSYRTLVGNDTDGTAHGYKIHLVYGALTQPTEKAHASVNDNSEAATFSWEVSTTPVGVTVEVDGKVPKPTASIEIDSTKVDKDKLAALEAMLYGDESNDAHLPLPDEVLELLKETTETDGEQAEG